MVQSKEKVQVLVATMNQKDFSKVEKMKIASDIFFANQTDTTGYIKKEYNGFIAEMLNTETRGVGVNRNFALQYASGDILLLADDDMVYHDGYAETVLKSFSEHPDADAIIFNIETVGAQVQRRINTGSSAVHIFNALNYGAVRIAVRRKSLIKERICFSTCFGGGTSYSAGEDSLFICDMLRKGFKIYTSPEFIATVDQSTSSWFSGYNQKYIFDKGAFYAAAFGPWALAFGIQDLLRHKKIYKEAELNLIQAVDVMKKGTKAYKNIQAWSPNDEERVCVDE